MEISFRRDPRSLADGIFDIAIIGGGIAGACIARDAARRGLTVALVEASDFSSGTSAGSSKLAHGGLRYLQQLDVKVVRESLAERARWAAIAPHLVRPMPFLFPMSGTHLSRLALRAAFAAYEYLDKAGRMPRARIAARAEVEALEPALAGAVEHGCVLYYEYQIESPERVALECLIDAAAHGAKVANYVAMERLESADGTIRSMIAIDRLDGARYEIRARAFVNATGPWADFVEEAALQRPAPFALVRSKGIHLVARRFLATHAVAVKHAGRHLFAIPWRGRTLIGTTDTLYDGDPRDARVEEEEEAGMVARLNAALPGAGLGPDDIVHRYAAVRPLVGRGDSKGGTYGLSREGEIVDHGDRGGPANLWTVIGGKWTTARLVAEQAVDSIAARLGSSVRPCDTASAPLPHAFGPACDRQAVGSKLTGFPDDVREQLLASYGTAAPDVAAAAAGDPDLLGPIGEGVPHIGAEALYAVRHEMAQTADDILCRRTSVVPLGGDTRRARVLARDALA